MVFVEDLKSRLEGFKVELNLLKNVVGVRTTRHSSLTALMSTLLIKFLRTTVSSLRRSSLTVLARCFRVKSFSVSVDSLGRSSLIALANCLKISSFYFLSVLAGTVKFDSPSEPACILELDYPSELSSNFFFYFLSVLAGTVNIDNPSDPCLHFGLCFTTF